MNIRNSNIYQLIRRFWYRMKDENPIEECFNRMKYKKSFEELKDIHNGKRCFIIGNGPSLTAEDLTLIKNEYTFAANRIFYMFEKTEWRPTYYCSQDIVVIKDIAEKLVTVLPFCEKMILNRCCKNVVPKKVRDNEKVLFFCGRYKTGHKELEFSESIENYICDGGSITYAAIQMAIYMGFKEIYLIGVDHNYSSSSFKDNEISSSDVKNSYFEGMPSNIKMNRPNTDNVTYSYIKAREYAEKLGVKIYNSTRGGKLEVYPRVSLENVLKRS